MDQQNNNSKDNKATQDKSGKNVGEGQEDYSILHDKPDSQKELFRVTQNDISSTSQEEFVDDDKNNIKKEE